jgi:hypothetical protein
MIKVAPYIQTIRTEEFKKFLSLPFNFNTLNPQNELTLFDCWRCKDMVNWHKYTNDDKIVLEVYAESYNITVKSKTYTLPNPTTINDFIGDMNRFNIQLYWTNWIDENFEPKDYLRKDEIRMYYFNLLNKLGKSHELN